MKDIVKSTLTGIILVFCVVFALMIQTNAANQIWIIQIITI